MYSISDSIKAQQAGPYHPQGPPGHAQEQKPHGDTETLPSYTTKCNMKLTLCGTGRSDGPGISAREEPDARGKPACCGKGQRITEGQPKDDDQAIQPVTDRGYVVSELTQPNANEGGGASPDRNTMRWRLAALSQYVSPKEEGPPQDAGCTDDT